MMNREKIVPAIAEDTVVYTLFPSENTDISSVTALSTLISAHVDAILPPNHIWHRDSFDLRVVPLEENVAKHWVISGTMRIGDCIDDEWCTVWLLAEISRKWDLVISVYDSDGEFLLIEAADHLPNWVDPENVENRVWIYNGSLHLVPLEYISPPYEAKHPRRRIISRNWDDDEAEQSDNKSFISEVDAARLVRQADTDTIASPAIQLAIRRKIDGYPAVLSQHTHLTKAYLPADIVLALSQAPALVQKAVEAFYTRDGLQLRAASKMTRFPPSSSIYAPVRLTRTAYAQLRGQKFHPPKVFGKWQEVEGTNEWRWKDIGMKIACGFEMLSAEGKGKQLAMAESGENMDAVKDALRRDQSYLSYIQALKQAGFFPSDEMEGSTRWKEHEDRATRLWVQTRKSENTSRLSFTTMVDQAIAAAEHKRSELLESGADGSIKEDSDAWLEVQPDDLERAFGNAGPSGSQKQPLDADASQSGDDTKNDHHIRQQAKKLGDLAEKVGKFVEGPGHLEGAVFDDEFISDDEEEYLPDSIESDEESDGRSDAVEAREAALNSLVAPLAPGEYGRLPAAISVPSQSRKDMSHPETATDLWTTPSGDKRPSRRPLILRDRYDGVDSDDESEDEDDAMGADQLLNGAEEEYESDEEKPAVAGVHLDIDIDMQEEQEDFVNFARQALGLSDEAWADIVKDRESRGAFLPTFKSRGASTGGPAVPSADKLDTPPLASASSRTPLSSFEAVMQAMDTELQRSREGREALKKLRKEDHDANSETKRHSQDARPTEADLANAHEAPDASDSGSEDEESELTDAGMDYNLIKNFLESFKSQSGLAGPVGSLASRLDPTWTLPRHNSSD